LMGCFFIGMAFGWLEKGLLPPHQRLFFITGLLGGFTTFSAFSIETITLLRLGQWHYALAYVLASVGLGLMATVTGIALSRTL
ncbi:MAG: CrcB family protein, partial [Chitinophagales bacterium]|nr:CrcB family protein [Chitinophagales bacterium]MCS6991661.1 CrcB family protein [Chitinophagales bacterium]MDW8428351.1 CrcB family protein [Chitinophagales bacterium]